jgi:hypothetical protein
VRACVRVSVRVCVQSSDAAARSFAQPAYCTSCKDEKSVMTMKKTMWKQCQLHKGCTHDMWADHLIPG